MDGRGVRAVLLGAPGSGKGTQAERLSASLGVPAISTGEILRQAVARGTELGSRVAAIMASGRLVDDELMAEVVRDRLDQAGCRRRDSCSTAIRGRLRRRRRWPDCSRAPARGSTAVVLLDVPEDVLVRRALARRRADDREEVIRERLRIYREKTEPLIGFYEKQGLLVRIDGNRPWARSPTAPWRHRGGTDHGPEDGGRAAS